MYQIKKGYQMKAFHLEIKVPEESWRSTKSKQIEVECEVSRH